jgi:hypothetical protein
VNKRYVWSSPANPDDIIKIENMRIIAILKMPPDRYSMLPGKSRIVEIEGLLPWNRWYCKSKWSNQLFGITLQQAHEISFLSEKPRYLEEAYVHADHFGHIPDVLTCLNLEWKDVGRIGSIDEFAMKWFYQ